MMHVMSKISELNKTTLKLKVTLIWFTYFIVKPVLIIVSSYFFNVW